MRLTLAKQIDEDTIASGEWPANWSLASYEDVGEYYAGRVLKEAESNNVSGIMTTNIVTAGPNDDVKVRSPASRPRLLPFFSPSPSTLVPFQLAY